MKGAKQGALMMFPLAFPFGCRNHEKLFWFFFACLFCGPLSKNVFEIHFPKSFTAIMKVLKVIPNGLYFRIVEKGMKKIVD